MKLISMTDFVSQYVETGCAVEQIRKIRNYSDFLKQPLTLGVFIPCDDEGNVLEEPVDTIGGVELYSEKYQQAKEKVLFEDSIITNSDPYKMTKRFMIDLKHPTYFRLYNKFTFTNGDINECFLPNFREIPTIEYLVKFELSLTQSAIKQIGL